MRRHGLQTKSLRRPNGGRPCCRRSRNLSGSFQRVRTSSGLRPHVRETAVALDLLGVLIDAFSRRCIGWALGTRITAELAWRHCEWRLFLVSKKRAGAPFRRGGQYGSSIYQGELLEYGLEELESAGDTHRQSGVRTLHRN